MSLFLYFCFSWSLDFRRITAFAKCSNMSIISTSSLSYKFNNHPLILSIRQFSPIFLTLKSFRIDGSYSPIFYGSSIHLSLIDSTFYDIFNETINIKDQQIFSSNSFGMSKLHIINCKFISINYVNNNGGAINMWDSTIVANSTLFSECTSSKGSALYTTNTTVKLSQCNFTFNTALDYGATAFDNSNVELKECLYFGCFARDSSALFNYMSNSRVYKCGFVNNVAEYGMCASFYKSEGIIRKSDFYHNNCFRTFDSVDISESGVLSILNSNIIQVIGCHFIENTKDNGKPDIPIVVSGYGKVKVSFCYFDQPEKSSVISTNDVNLSLIIRNTMNDKYPYKSPFQDLVYNDSSNFASTFRLDFNQFHSLKYLLGLISGFVALFVIAIGALLIVF